MAAGLAGLPQLGGGVPKGYLRVLVFGADSALVGQQVQPLSAAALNSYEPLRLQVRVPQDGYVTAYVGNESDVDVLFDDVSVEHRQGLQVQETQYDPTGLELAGLSGSTPGLKALSQYKFNGKEFQADLGLHWNHQDWRFFDPQLGRWHVGDPEIENGQESWTPYSFGYDNAVRYADADGRCPGGCPPVPDATVLQQVGAATAATITAAVEGAGVILGGISAGTVAGAAAIASAFVIAGEVLSHPETYGGAGRPTYMMGQPNGPTFKATNENGQINASSTTRPARRIDDGPSKGRLGNKATKDQVKEVADEMTDRGYEVKGGGGRAPEEHLPGPGGKSKGGSYPDITATKDGRTVRVNTIDTRKDGTPTPREAANAVRIRQQTPGDHLLLIPKK